jgi:hypothetical protein
VRPAETCSGALVGEPVAGAWPAALNDNQPAGQQDGLGPVVAGAGLAAFDARVAPLGIGRPTCPEGLVQRHQGALLALQEGGFRLVSAVGVGGLRRLSLTPPDLQLP